MAWEIKSDRPVYIQIINHIERDIVAGEYAPGSSLPSVRDLAAQAAVNPNTMQKALSELEKSGLVYTKRTSGRFVTTDTKLIQSIRENLAKQYTDDFLTKITSLGYSKAEAIDFVTKHT